MNALILSALSGVIMMFSGIVLKDNKSGARLLAMILLAIIIVANLLQLRGVEFFSVDTKGMLLFDRFATLFTLVIFICTFFFFLLSAKEMEKVGKDYSEFFALIFFILAGTILVSAFKSLLILFIGIEIISIPLYILTSSDKRNLKSNEAGLKYFFDGLLFNRINADGNCSCIRSNRHV